jgi:2-dehydro-3-deoxygalactonokinase
METTFLSCDWGTSSFRLRLVEVNSLKIIAEVKSDEGISKVYESWQQVKSEENDRLSYYKSVLGKYVAVIERKLNISLNGTVIVMSGMASSSIGMMELPYKHLPFSIKYTDVYIKKIKALNDGQHDVLLVSGVKTDTDVMRGEETQLLGCTIKADTNKQVFIFPGTHSKHIVVENGEAIDFKTYMTGEFFHLLSTNSLLSNSVLPGSSLDTPENETAFAKGVLEGQDQNLLHQSFIVRTNDLFHRFSKEQNYWYLSGMVIGTELNELWKQPVQSVTVVSEGKLIQFYKRAFKALGAEKLFKSVDVNQALLKAHQKIYVEAYALK